MNDHKWCAYSVGQHGCKDWSLCIVGVELGDETHGDDNFNEENDGV